MQEIAIIELVEYQRHETWKKPSHAGTLNTLEATVETEKHYRLKFSSNCNYRFCDWIKEKGGHYAFWMDPRDVDDIRFFPRCSDDNIIPSEYSCFCEAMTSFLLENGFKISSIGNIIHVFTKN